MLRRKGTTTIEQRAPSEGTETQRGDMPQDRPVGDQPGPYSSDVRRESTVAAPPRGDGHAVREQERMAGREEMVQPGPISFGRYLANWYTMLVGSALVLAETVLALRLFFKLASADNTNWIVKFTYHLSGVLIRPFTDIITNHELAGGIFEPAVVIAMAIFLVGAVLAIWVVRSFASLRSWGSGLVPR